MSSTNATISSYNRRLKIILNELNSVMKEGLKQEEPKFHYANIKITNWVVQNLDNSIISCYRELSQNGSQSAYDFMKMKRCINRNQGKSSTELLTQTVVIAHKNFYDTDLLNLFETFLELRSESYAMWKRIRAGLDATEIVDKPKPINNNPVVETVINEILSQVPKNLKHSFREQLQRVDNPLQHLQRLIKSNNLNIKLS
ncbi:hypothetical protein HWC21_gp118 [Vibrio phage VAP7]|uniref:Uncharacterized protein n=1 Tax=Vibrio phage VAP7 TaxID=2584487 RepID=A0A4Y5TVA3_9CAUD|nr:hypothetical protein HWC21_gp118 [Vibrio phage VAP7]QDB73300.1 hypothetical protein [Vibrio phage VAP7]